MAGNDSPGLTLRMAKASLNQQHTLHNVTNTPGRSPQAVEVLERLVHDCKLDLTSDEFDRALRVLQAWRMAIATDVAMTQLAAVEREFL